MANEVIVCLLVCFIYQGLLAISYVVHDPFGEDLLDFPILAYTQYAADCCDAVIRAQEQVPALAVETAASGQQPRRTTQFFASPSPPLQWPARSLVGGAVVDAPTKFQPRWRVPSKP